MTIVSPPPRIDRDHFGRPLVVPPGGDKAVPYTRCTTFVDVLEDKYNLQKWMLRMTALGLASRPDLLLSVQAHRDDKGALDRICEAAKEAAAATAAATTGTALHALTELIDRGEDLPVLPPDATAGLEAYREATADLKPVHIEQFCVQDALKIGGTPDRVVEYQGKRYIADLKTGSVEWGVLKMSMQLAVYARSHLYDVASHKRSPHGADLDRALIVHLPAGEARCELLWIDIHTGWHSVLLARDVRYLRKRRDLTRAFDDDTPFAKASDPPTAAPKPLAEQVATATTRAQIEALWAAHEGEWDESLTLAAKERLAALELLTAS